MSDRDSGWNAPAGVSLNRVWDAGLSMWVPMPSADGNTVTAHNQVWDPDLLDWVNMVQPGGGSGDVTVTSSVLPTGASTSARQDTGNTALAAIQTAVEALEPDGLTDTQLRATAVPVSLATVPTHAVTQSGTWTVQPGNTANTTAWKVDGSAVTQPVSGTVTTTVPTSATATLSNVNDDTTSATLLALNTSRKGASIYNDSTELLYVKLGTTASATSFTVRVAPQGYYEVPFGYTGRIDGIWAVNGSGAARMTEFT